MIEGSVFIAAVVIAVVDAIKSAAPRVQGATTVLVAGAIGGLISLVDVQIGLADLTFAQGVMAGLSGAGAVAVAKRVG